MNKKFTKMFLLLFALLAPAVGWAQDETVQYDNGTYTWNAELQGYVLTAYDGSWAEGGSFDFILPWNVYDSNWGGYDVKGVGPNAFTNCENLTRIRIDNPLDKVIDPTAFSGIGSNAPVLLDTDYPQAVLNKNNATCTNGIYTLGGGLFKVEKTLWTSGYVITYQLNGDSYVVTGYTEEEGRAENYPNPTININSSFGDYQWKEEYESWDWINIPVSGVKANALAGIGSADAPVNVNMDIQAFKSSGGLFSEGYAQLGGGYFKIGNQYIDYDIRVFYTYSEDAAGNGYYLLSDAQKYEWASDDADFRLVIRGSIYGGWDSETHKDIYYPVICKTGFADGVKDILKGVEFWENYNYNPEFQENALAGIGTVETPLSLSIDINVFKSMGGAFSNGIAQLAGGNFQIVREQRDYSIKAYYVYTEDAAGNGSYLVTKTEKEYPWYSDDDDFRIYLRPFLTEWNNQDQMYTYIPVVFKAGFTDGVKDIVKGIYIENNDGLPNLEEGCLTGIGSADNPISVDVAVKDFKTMGGTFSSTGLAQLKGGCFQLARHDNHEGIIVNYAYSEDAAGNGSYVATKAEKAEWYGDDYNFRLYIRGQFNGGWDDETQTYVYYPVTYKAGFADGVKDIVKGVDFGEYDRFMPIFETTALADFGTVDNPLAINLGVADLKSMGGTFGNGIAQLAGGSFQILRTTEDRGIIISYAYSEDADGNPYYAAIKAEKSQWWSDNDENFGLVLRGQFYEGNDKEAGKSIYSPVKYKANFADGVRHLTIKTVEFWDYDPCYASFEDGALEGFGTDDAPITLDLDVKAVKGFGAKFSNGIAQIGGGKFSIEKTNTDYLGLRTYYAYNEDADGNPSWIATKAEVPIDEWWAGDESIEYYLTIYGAFEEWDNQTQTYAYYPIKYKSGFVDEVKDIVKSVRFNSYDHYGPAFEEGALTGIGSADAPYLVKDVWNPEVLAMNIDATVQNAVYNLGGGYFQFVREYDYVYYALDGKEYSIVGYDAEAIQQCIDNGWEFSIDLRNSFDFGYNDNEGNYQYEEYFVTKAMPNALNGLTGYTNFYFNAMHLTEVGEDAFKGIGSADEPLRVRTDNPMYFTSKFAFTPENGVYNLGGGYLQFVRQDGVLYYAANGDEFVLVGYNKDEVDDHIEYGWYLVVSIQNEISEWTPDEEGNYSWHSYKVTKVAPNALNGLTGYNSFRIYANNLTEIGTDAFKGFGTADAPLDLDANSPVRLVTQLNAQATDGVYNLGGGYFQIIKNSWSDGLEIRYQLNGEEYLVSGYTEYENRVEDYPYGSELRIQNSFSEGWNNAEGEWENHTYYVTKVKANAFNGLTNVKSVVFNDSLKAVGTDAFKGFGTESKPMYINKDYPISYTKIFPFTAENGIYNLGGGYFQIVRKADFFYYAADGEEYTLVGYDKNDIQQYADYGWSWNAYVQGEMSERCYNEEGNYQWLSFRVTKVAPNALNGLAGFNKFYMYASYLKEVGADAFKGIGTADAPLDLEVENPVHLTSSLQVTPENGIYNLGGGYFYFTRSSWSDGIDVIYRLNGEEYTISGYTEEENRIINYPDGSSLRFENTMYEYWYDAEGVYHGQDYYVTKIADNAFAGLTNVREVKLLNNYWENQNIKEIGADAFKGIGTADAPVALSISPISLLKMETSTVGEATVLAGGCFEVMRIVEENGLRFYYKYVDRAYELTKVEEQNTWWDEFTGVIRDGFQIDCEEDVEWTDINGEVITNRWPVFYVTKVRANAFADVADKIVGVTISNSYGNTKIAIADGAFAGIGSVDRGATFTANNTVILANLGEKQGENLFDIKGGLFTMYAITIKAQKNPNNNYGYVIPYVYGRDANYNWVNLISWNNRVMMDEPVEGSDFYTYTLLGSSVITNIEIYSGEKVESDGESWINTYEQVFHSMNSLELTTDTTFVWYEKKNRLVLKDAPIEHDFWLADQFVTSANADDIFANDEQNAGKAYYDEDSNTLTLEGVNLSAYGDAFRNDNNGLIVKLIGDNTIRADENDFWSYASMSINGATTLTGEGTLNIIGSNQDITATDGSWGELYGYYPLTITGGATLNLSNMSRFYLGSDLTIDHSVLNIAEMRDDNRPFYAGNLQLIGSKIQTLAGAQYVWGRIYDAEGVAAKAISIVVAPGFDVAINVTNLSTGNAENATLTVDDTGSIIGILTALGSLGNSYSIVLPESVTNPDTNKDVTLTSIAGGALAMANLKSLTLPKSIVLSIGTGAVNETTKIHVPLQYLGQYASQASLTDNVYNGTLVADLLTTGRMMTLSADVNLKLDQRAKYYTVRHQQFDQAVTGVLYADNVLHEWNAVLIEVAQPGMVLELAATFDGATASLSENLLRPVVGADYTFASWEAPYSYVLNGNEFDCVNMLDNAVVKSNEAYLYMYDPEEGPNAYVLLSIELVNLTTGVEGTEAAEDENAAWYGINGQRINEPTRSGVYIKNGKKVVVRKR